jgi:hypothetical protein
VLDVLHPSERHERAQEVRLRQDEEGEEEVILDEVDPGRQDVRAVVTEMLAIALG